MSNASTSQRSDRVISAELLANDRAFSVRNQPYLGDLIDSIRESELPLTLVIGAGVSMDAGLPSWRELISRLQKNELTEPERRQLRELGDADLQRTAQIIMHLARGRGLRTDYNRVETALFRDGQWPMPGQLAEAIARLVGTYKRDVRVITTNYDTVVEDALDLCGLKFSSYSLAGSGIGESRRNDVNEWDALDIGNRGTAVMHIHGLLRPGDKPLEPLILTETDFQLHGQAVQTFLSRVLPGTLAIFIGVGLADPNLLGPLRAIREGGGRVFVVTVPQLTHPKLGQPECAEFATKYAGMLKDDLGVKPILFRSFGQVTQLISDLSLAHVEPSAYREKVTPVKSSLHYETRYRHALEECYRALGFSPKTGRPVGDASHLVSRRLFELSRARGGPLRVLREFREKYRGEISPDENFGVFLWLRSPDNEAIQGNSLYSVRQVAASTYAHWEPWSSELIKPVESISTYTPALAVFTGRPTFVNYDAGARGLWRGSVSVPLVQYGYRSDATLSTRSLDRLTLGAMSINSTRCVLDAAGGDTQTARVHSLELEDVSVLMRLDPDETSRLYTSLFEVVEELFG